MSEYDVTKWSITITSEGEVLFTITFAGQERQLRMDADTTITVSNALRDAGDTAKVITLNKPKRGN